jgi:small subunit ribosomal protein S1
MSHPKVFSDVSEEEAVSSDRSSFGDILTQFEQEQHASPTDRAALQGTVIKVDEESVYVDIGRKMEGRIEALRLRDVSGQPTAKAGDMLIVNVTGRDEEGYYTLSTVRVERPRDWSGLELAFSEKRTIAGQVQEVVKGGLRVDVGARAFLPASRSGARDIAEMEKLVGQEIRCRITKLDVANEDVVVDRRVVLEEEAAESRQKAFSGLRDGEVIRGTVRSLTDFGAFIDLGGVDGLLHVADMSWTRIAKPSDILSAGDSVEVKILKLNPDTRRISLGMKQLQPDPWTLAVERFKPGDRVHGTVSRLSDFGAFVELTPGVDGLIHVSEMSWSKKVRKPSDVLKKGESVDVVVLGVNAAEHRISLGLKQALGDPWEEAEKKFAPGTIVEGKITSLQKFGAFVELGEGIEGMIHVGDISREKRINHPNEVLKTGQAVRASVLEVDRGKRRIRLGMKQLEPTSADEYISEHQPDEVVSGRVVDVSHGRAKIELGEGVHAMCRLGGELSSTKLAQSDASRADLSQLTAMLTAKWKEGKASQSEPEPLRPGQIRSFRIISLDPAQKRIDVELA